MTDNRPPQLKVQETLASPIAPELPALTIPLYSTEELLRLRAVTRKLRRREAYARVGDSWVRLLDEHVEFNPIDPDAATRKLFTVAHRAADIAKRSAISLAQARAGLHALGWVYVKARREWVKAVGVKTASEARETVRIAGAREVA